MLSVFSQPGFVNERITSPSLHKQLSSKLMCPGVPCSALAVLEIYTRDLSVAETSQYPAGVEDTGTQEHYLCMQLSHGICSLKIGDTSNGSREFTRNNHHTLYSLAASTSDCITG